MHDTGSRCVDNEICFVCSSDLTKSNPPSNAIHITLPPSPPADSVSRVAKIYGFICSCPPPFYVSLCVSVIFYADIAMRLKMRNGRQGKRMAEGGVEGEWIGAGPLKPPQEMNLENRTDRRELGMTCNAVAAIVMQN